MHFRAVPVLSLVGSVAAFGPFGHGGSGPFGGGGSSSDDNSSVENRQTSDACAPWVDMANTLSSIFLDSNNQCTDDARACIRTVFHDCHPQACDGSLITTDECSSRQENTQMRPMCEYLAEKVSPVYGAADLIQLASSLGTAYCMGPIVPFYVGRTDATEPNPPNQLPSGDSTAEQVLDSMGSRGFTADDTVALVGAHSTGKTLGGVPLDTTVTDWDVTFYSETADGTAPATIPSDKNLAESEETSATWTAFANSDQAWQMAYLAAIKKMIVLGNDISSLTDCTQVITDAVNSRRRSYVGGS